MEAGVRAELPRMIDPELFTYHFGSRVQPQTVESKLDTRVPGVFVLSIDICSYSAFVRATADLSVATAMLREFCDRCREAVIQSGGAVDRVTGDSVLAFWGLVGEVSYRVPLETGFRLLGIAEEISDRWQREIDEVVSPRGARAGLSFGEVTFMTIASAYPGFSLLGSCVNLAARLQALAEPGNLLVSNRFRSLIGNDLGAGAHRLIVEPFDDGDDAEGVAVKNMGSVHAFRVERR